MPLPEMKKSLFFLWKIGEKKFRFHQVLAWKCRKTNDIDTSSGKPICDCSRFKFESKCVHTRAFEKRVLYVFSPTRTMDESEAIEWTHRDTPDKGCVIVYDHNADSLFCVSSYVGDLSAFNLLWLISKGETDVTKKAKDECGLLNPLRIYTELNKSVEDGLHVDDPEIIRVGSAIDGGAAIPIDFSKVKETKTEEEEEFNEDIGFEEKKSAEEEVEEIEKKIPFWKECKRPSPDNFYVSKDDWDQLIFAAMTGTNVLLIGPSGSGKSELCYLVSQAIGRELVPFNMGAMSEPRTSLIGNTHFDRDKGTWFQASRFVKAVQSDDGVVLLDEITRATRNAFNILLPLLDRQGYLALDESEDAAVIHKAKNMCFMSTANVGMEYTGTEPLDKALKERFSVIIDLSFPPEASEVRILLGRCKGLDKKVAERLVKIANHQRHLVINEGEFVEMISTRMLLAAGTQIAAGMAFEAATKFCVENHFNAEGGDASDRTKIRQVIQKFGK